MASSSINATKTPIKNFFPNAYGKFSLRTYQTIDTKKNNETIGKLQARYTLGSSFFNNKLDTSFVFAANKFSDEMVVKDRGTRMENTFDLYSNDNISFKPGLEIWSPSAGFGTKIVASSKLKVQTRVMNFLGSFTPYFSGKANVYLGSRANDIRIQRDGQDMLYSDASGLALTNIAEDKNKFATVKQQSPSQNRSATFGMSFKPAISTKLSVEVYTSHAQRLTPIYEYNPATKNVEEKTSKFFGVTTADRAVKYSRWSAFDLSYTLDDTTSISNSFGFSGRENGALVYESVLAINMTTF